MLRTQIICRTLKAHLQDIPKDIWSPFQWLANPKPLTQSLKFVLTSTKL